MRRDKEVQPGEGPCGKIITTMISFALERNAVEPTIHDGPVLFRNLEKYSLENEPEGQKLLG